MAQDTREQPTGIAGRYLALILFLVAAVLAIVVGVLFVTMQDDTDEEASPGGDVSGTASRIDEILADPEQWQDQDITLVGNAGEVLGDRVFILTGNEAGQEILVASTTPFTADAGAEPEQQVDAGNQVQVIGTVGILTEENRAALGTNFAFLLDDPAFADYTGEPIILTNLEGIDVQDEPE